LIRKALKKIFDPEIPMNIVDLGLIYGYDWADDQHLKIRMTMTGPGCPVAGILAEEVQTAATQAAQGVSEVKVEVVWDPPWGPEKMSDFAKRQFGYL
jgi:metal-sulfur cluster biosynthetic enzyme